MNNILKELEEEEGFKVVAYADDVIIGFKDK